VTKRSVISLLVALAGLIGWVGGILAYVNWFPEEGGGPGKEVVGGLMWTSALVGLAATIAFGVSVWRTPRD